MSFHMKRAMLCALLIGVGGLSSRAQVSINEVLADNTRWLAPDGSVSDWVELYNAGAQPASLAGYSLTDTPGTPLKWVFPSGVQIPAKGFLLVLLDSGRPASTTPGGLLNAGFSIKGSGDEIELYSPVAALVESVSFGPQVTDYSIGRVPAGLGNHTLCVPTPGSANIAQSLGPQDGLRINEWMASPASGNDWFEIYNTGTLPVSFNGMYFTDDGNTPSPVAPLSFVGAGNAAFLRFFANNSTNGNEVNFKLSGTGDSISLFTGTGAKVDAVRFGQQTADRSEGRLPDGDANVTALNRATPGASNLSIYEGLVVNELLSHTDPPLEDAVEFYNQLDTPIDISGWYLSNSRHNLRKYRLPDKIVIAPKSYLVVYEWQFNRAGDPNAFTFNSAHGDEVYLSQATASGALTGYIVGETFEAAENSSSFGRYETSIPGEHKFVIMDRRTFGMDLPASVEEFRTGKGAPNSGPRVGPVVINEVMYHPPAAADGADDTEDEFIELHSIIADTVVFYDAENPGNAWKLEGGISFDFPVGAQLPGGSYALVVSFDPGDTARLNAFKTKYSVPSGVQFFGPYSGRLGNGGDEIELLKPDHPQLFPHPDAGFVPYIRVDRLNYKDLSPWPVEPDGNGPSLQRKNSALFGNDPANWQGAAPSAGRSNSPDILDSDGDGIPDVWEADNGLNPNDAADAGVDLDGDGFTNVQEYLAGTDPRLKSSTLALQVQNGTDGVTLNFSAVPGRSYTVQYRNTLLPSSVWQTLRSVTADSSQVSLQESNPAKSARFYRVVTPAAE